MDVLHAYAAGEQAGEQAGEIAARLRIKPSTLRSHRELILRTLGVETIAEAVAVISGQPQPTPKVAKPKRLPKGDPVTPAQRLYLRAFDKFLLERSDEAKAKARWEMDHLLGTMCIERDVPKPRGGGRRPREGLDPLMALLDAPLAA